MTTFYSEVLPSIDWTNPLSGYLKAALLPKGGSISELINLIDETTHQFITGGIVYNQDGSVSGTAAGTSTVAELNNTSNCIQSAGLLSTTNYVLATDFIYAVDINVGAQNNNQAATLLTILPSNSRTQLVVGLDNWNSENITVNCRNKWVSAIFDKPNSDQTSTGRGLRIVYWNSTTRVLTIYEDGLVVFTGDISSSIQDTQILNTSSILFGVGRPIDKFYSAQLFEHLTGSFTQAEIDSIVADPYQVFQTQTQVNEEYSLNFTIAAHTITIPFVGAYTGTLYLTDGTTQAIPAGTGTYTLTGATPINLLKIDGTDTNGFHLFSLNKTKGITVTSETSTLVLSLSGFPVDSGYVRDVNGVIEGYQFDGSTHATINGNITLTGDFELACEVSYSDITKTVLTVKVDNNRWVGLWANKFICYFGAVIITLPTKPINNTKYIISVVKVGDTITLSANGESNTGVVVGDSLINGFSTNTEENLIYSSTIKQLGVAVYNYDFTTGDQGKIVETLQGKHAIITNDSVVKWQPILPVDVSLIKSDGTMDYVSAFNYEAAVVNITNHKIGYVYGDTGESAAIRPVDQLGIFELSAVKGQEADFKGAGAKLGTSIIETARGTSIFRNLNVVGGFKVGVSNNTSNDTIIGCYLNGKGNITTNGITLSTSTTAKFNIRDVLIVGYYDGIYSSNVSVTQQTTIVNNCRISEASRYGLLRVNAANNVISGSGVGDFLQVVGYNNISSDTSAVTQGVGTQDTLLNTYFTNPATNDYTINTVGQTALAGKGVNGTDIVSWAYAAQVIAIALSGTITASTTEVDIVNGGKTLILTLSGDTWQSAGTAFDAQRQAIINGLVSAQSELTGWNNEVKGKELVTSVVRTSNTVLTITLSAQLLYNITANETVTTIIPSTALTNSTSAIHADITFTIVPTVTGFKIVWARNTNTLIGGI